MYRDGAAAAVEYAEEPIEVNPIEAEYAATIKMSEDAWVPSFANPF